jgi:signal transduction histidine kinase
MTMHQIARGSARPIGHLPKPVRSGASSLWPPSRAATARLWTSPQRDLILTLLLGMLTGCWAVVNLLSGGTGFAVLVPDGYRGGSEAAISLARLFAALVLLLMGTGPLANRLRWVAAGFLVLGLGQLVFGYMEPFVNPSGDINAAIYQMVLVRSLASVLFIVGLIPAQPPRATMRIATIITLGTLGAIGGYVALKAWGTVPELVSVDTMSTAVEQRITPLSWMSTWHWLLAAPLLLLACMAAWGAIRRNQEGLVSAWLPIALVLLAASELHDSLWPSAYGASRVMNTADVLRLAMAAMVAVGGVFELRRIAIERSVLLQAEHDRAQRLEELTTLKADFTAMVAHELGYPLSAIRRQAELLGVGEIDDAMRTSAVEAILNETNTLDARIRDIQASASIERDDFRPALRPLAIGDIVHDARIVALGQAAHGRLEVELDRVSPDDLVNADRDRIGQVIGNLLCNAAKYSRDREPVTLRIAGLRDRVRMAVVDRGPGIPAEDRGRIFEKFGRGQSAGSDVSGTGLGLYICQRIVRAHGSDLTVDTEPGGGSIFAFTLTRSSA